jgi:methylphosphotriester-DNA--protein-cysteine methyltransferase
MKKERDLTPKQKAVDAVISRRVYLGPGPGHARVTDAIAAEIDRCVSEAYDAGYRAGQRSKRVRAREAADSLASAVDAVLDEISQDLQRTPPGPL